MSKKKEKDPKVNEDGLVEVEIEGIDDKTWSILNTIAKREGKTVDQVASEALRWAYDNNMLEDIAKKAKKEQERKNGKK